MALAYLLLLGSLVVSQSSRPDRMAGLYPALFACGAAQLEKVFLSMRARALVLAGLKLTPAELGPAWEAAKKYE